MATFLGRPSLPLLQRQRWYRMRPHHNLEFQVHHNVHFYGMFNTCYCVTFCPIQFPFFEATPYLISAAIAHNVSSKRWEKIEIRFYAAVISGHRLNCQYSRERNQGVYMTALHHSVSGSQYLPVYTALLWWSEAYRTTREFMEISWTFKIRRCRGDDCDSIIECREHIEVPHLLIANV
jgi:hypothetical protein